MWKLNNTSLCNQWVKEKIKRKIRKDFEMNESEDTTYQNVGDAVKAVVKGKFIAVKDHINNLALYLATLEKEKHIKPRAHTRRKVIKIRAEINKMENRKK